MSIWILIAAFAFCLAVILYIRSGFISYSTHGPGRAIHKKSQKSIVLSYLTLSCGALVVFALWGQENISFGMSGFKLKPAPQVALNGMNLNAPIPSNVSYSAVRMDDRTIVPAKSVAVIPLHASIVMPEAVTPNNQGIKPITLPAENDEFALVGKALASGGQKFRVFTAKAGSKDIDFEARYTFPGRPILNADELEDLRNSQNPVSKEETVASLETEPSAGIDRAGETGRKFIIVKSKPEENIKLTHFGLKRANNEVLISWTTEFEKYSDYFAIERSVDGKTFQEIGRVNGAGDYKNMLLYTFLDNTGSGKGNSYRLKQVDFSGNETFFQVK